MRIVSLLPSTTEILFAIGAGDSVHGVTFECDFPPQARERRVISTSTMPEGLTPTEIDAWVVQARHRGEDLYHLDEGALRDIDADLVVTQDLCAVCAIDVTAVDEALAHLGCTADVFTFDPHSLEELFTGIEELGEATGYAVPARELVADQRARLADLEQRLAGRPRPRVLLLEWTDPPFAPGHWVPEMIERAGGTTLLGNPGADSGRITWEQIHAAAPDVVVVAPCGYDRAGSQAQADQLSTSGLLPQGAAVHAVDANASWARASTRNLDGIEELSRVLHPEAWLNPTG